ncbi:MAG: acyltransferase family protein [Bacteroides sp.]|nr:acyltransferase family protein [Alistipes timonensis]MCM1310983.1 acyltransferase family protein [Bacteroides sp.]MCM1405150.1 acyltransferase family protein [[Clostridium] fimetarium]
MGVSRNLKLDSIKGFLIVLVVFGHFIEPHIDNSLFLGAYLSIYSFHMPLFVILSGYFFNPFQPKEKFRWNLMRLCETFTVFQLLRFVLLARNGDVSISSVIEPYWILWYIFSLIVWRLVTKGLYSKFNSLNLKQLLAFALCASLVAGVVPLRNELAFQRTFYYYPFFIIGMIVKRESVGEFSWKLIGGYSLGNQFVMSW